MDKGKISKIFFNWQDQPIVPQNKNYYDLKDKEVLEKQSKMALSHGIDGFCYYHYWFKGKKLLEKPIEDMLTNTKVKIPFCLSWANHKWSRIWDGNSDETLMPMDYGNSSDWINHFNYLKNFFLDPRYIKKGNRPVFNIYQSNDFDQFDEMIQLWNLELKKIGLDKLYVIETFNFFQNKSNIKISEAVVLFEPMYTLSFSSNIFYKIYKYILHKTKDPKKPLVFNYDIVWREISNRNIKINQKKVFYFAFPNWDNTPRKKERGIVFKGMTVTKFKNYFKALLRKTYNSNNDFIFINSWNEWSEGAYLEPDNKNDFEILNSIKSNKQKNK